MQSSLFVICPRLPACARHESPKQGVLWSVQDQQAPAPDRPSNGYLLVTCMYHSRHIDRKQSGSAEVRAASLRTSARGR